jgi:hypothetical protein
LHQVKLYAIPGLVICYNEVEKERLQNSSYSRLSSFVIGFCQFKEELQMIKKNKCQHKFCFIMTMLLFIFSGCGSSNDDAVSSSDPEAIRESQIRELENSDLIGQVDAYAAIQGVLAEGAAPTPAKVFIIENDESFEEGAEEKYVYSPHYLDLPEELQAKSDAEMNVLVKLRSYYMETGTYSNEGIAYTRYVQITILDRVAGTIIHQETLIGSAPFSISEDQSAGYGYVPDYQVLEKILAYFGY